MRVTKVVLLVVAIGMTVGGAVLLWTGLGSDGPERLGLLIAGGTVAFVGLCMFVAVRYVAGLDDSPLLRTGIPASAQVLYTQDTGVVVSDVNLVVKVGLRVSVAGRAPYDTETRWVARGRQLWGALQPGMTIAVRIDPSDPRKVAIDTTGGSIAQPGFASPGFAPPGLPGVTPSATMTAPPSGVGTGPGPQIVTRSAADVIASGVKVDGQLLQVTPTGIAAGQVAYGLPADQADDPIVSVVFTYPGPHGPQQCQTLIRVPDGKAHHLVAGRAIPVAVLAHDPSSATVDWSRLP